MEFHHLCLFAMRHGGGFRSLLLFLYSGFPASGLMCCESSGCALQDCNRAVVVRIVSLGNVFDIL